MNNVQRLSTAFTTVVRKAFSAKELKEINARNAKYSPCACATHDFCDANMLMEEAFIETFGRKPQVDCNADAELWSAAWMRAKNRQFGY